MDKQIVNTYTNGEVTVKWEPHKCIHTTICFRVLPQVFDPSKRPWVNAQGTSTGAIVEQIKYCPSGALRYSMHVKSTTAVAKPQVSIEFVPNSPILINGECAVKYNDGTEGTINAVSALCRCGHSENKPLCDGSHNVHAFKV